MTRRPTAHWLLAAILALGGTAATVPAAPVVKNGGFERVSPGSDMPENWARDFGRGTRASIQVDDSVAHSGRYSMRISDQSPYQAFVFAALSSSFISVLPSTTYDIRCFVKGRKVGTFYIRADFGGALGTDQKPLPVSTYDWREVVYTITTPPECQRLRIQFVADDVTESIWVDDVSIATASAQLANLTERQYRKDYGTWLPRTPGGVAKHLVVADATGISDEDNMMLAALQGIVNRGGARLYLINRSDPPGNDNYWLKYMQEKGYTAEEERVSDAKETLDRFRGEVKGAIVYDPDVPGTINAAWMLAGLKNAIPTTAGGASRFGLTVIEDFRGRFTRNVDAYRYVYDRYWDKMNHYMLAWQYPDTGNVCSRDYALEWNVFCFWVSAPGDHEKGADPSAEEAFANQVLANTPGNVPVMGWMRHGALGVGEYTTARLLSEYGKWLLGTEFCSNLSVHSAIHPPAGTFTQEYHKSKPAAVQLERDKNYIAVDVLDSGDSLWYFQTYERALWADSARGKAPFGICMNPALCEAMPLVAQWYYETMSPNDSFFAYLYMNAPVYGERFRPEDRERIWREFVRLEGAYCQAMDMDGVEVYAGSEGSPPADSDLLRHFTRGIPNLNYILSGFGRNKGVTPGNANFMLDNVAVFQTQTHGHIWTSAKAVHERRMEDENAWVEREIETNAPWKRPGFLSALVISWTSYPEWIIDLDRKLPTGWVPVSAENMARLFRESQKQR